MRAQRLRRRLLFTVGVLAGLNLLMAFGAIALLSRMGPAIARILAENEYSIEAGEEMQAVMALVGPQGMDDATRLRFRRAMGRARANVTEDAERPVLRRMIALQQATLAGDPAARAEMLRQIHDLLAVNRAAMTREDERARRLGSAGAWAAVLLGFASFLLAIAALGRLDRHVLGPVVAVHEVLDAVDRGDHFRRCQLDGVEDLQETLMAINRLLDRAAGPPRAPAEGGAPGTAGSEERAALLRLLDLRAEPTALVGDQGALLAANEAADRLLQGEGGAPLREALRSLGSEQEPLPGLLEVHPLPGGAAWLCTFRGQGAEPVPPASA